LKQIKIAEPIERTEGSIIDDIALQSERLGAAQQEAAGFQDRRARLLATGTLAEIHALADSHARARLGAEIAQSRLDALNGELRRFYAVQAQSAVDAELKPLAAIANAELQAVADYETHARLASEALARLQDLDSARHEVSVRVHRLTGAWTQFDSPIRRRPITAQVKLPSATGDKDFWPPQSAALPDVQARAVRDAAALAEYHRQSE
jgi:hypothetical protein